MRAKEPQVGTVPCLDTMGQVHQGIWHLNKTNKFKNKNKKRPYQIRRSTCCYGPLGNKSVGKYHVYCRKLPDTKFGAEMFWI